ncbi:hypothetical protein [Vibrio harveyi]|uniref:hypothetical protein n=1 Tax=Vibrio harveyi TaxID=669 RepID=UPI003CF45ACC
MKLKLCKASLNAATQKKLKQVFKDVPDEELTSIGLDKVQFTKKIAELTEYKRGFVMIPRFEDEPKINKLLGKLIETAINSSFDEGKINKETKSKYLKSLDSWIRIGRWSSPIRKANRKKPHDAWRFMLEELVKDRVNKSIDLLRNNNASWIRLNQAGEVAIKDALSVNWGAYASASEGGVSRGKLYLRISMYQFKSNRVRPYLKHTEDYLANQDNETKTFYGPFDVVLSALVARSVCEAVYQANKSHPEYFDVLCTDLSSSREIYKELRREWINKMDGYTLKVPLELTTKLEPSFTL